MTYGKSGKFELVVKMNVSILSEQIHDTLIVIFRRIYIFVHVMQMKWLHWIPGSLLRIFRHACIIMQWRRGSEAVTGSICLTALLERSA